MIAVADRPGVPPIVAWRCEHCRKLYPPTMPGVVILIDEVGSRWSHSGAVQSRSRFARRMVVCEPDARSITGNAGA